MFALIKKVWDKIVHCRAKTQLCGTPNRAHFFMNKEVPNNEWKVNQNAAL